MAKVPLSPQAQRLRTIIVALPILIASSVVLYKREVRGEPRRTLPPPSELDKTNSNTPILDPVTSKGNTA
ncbi:hypothetical protein FA15DRAFT_668506 [Coprinopsis marcescibilis]|uniref:Uncharacterized protein n=1 Tax=Coprinopsis marcescibilis TaxID=230819 RepID=A0A5C3KXP2_COPMA|nr:hypothetical protein FA15DRAFT_668506 [Coprinopsis marcescibilis]